MKQCRYGLINVQLGLIAQPTWPMVKTLYLKSKMEPYSDYSSISSLLTARGGALSTGFIRLAHAQFEYLISTKSPVTPDELRTAYIFR